MCATERPVLGVRPFGRVPKTRRPLLRCAPSPPANLSGCAGGTNAAPPRAPTPLPRTHGATVLATATVLAFFRRRRPSCVALLAKRSHRRVGSAAALALSAASGGAVTGGALPPAASESNRRIAGMASSLSFCLCLFVDTSLSLSPSLPPSLPPSPSSPLPHSLPPSPPLSIFLSRHLLLPSFLSFLFLGPLSLPKSDPLLIHKPQLLIPSSNLGQAAACRG